MKIRNRLNPSNPCFSFEFFPPKTEEGVQKLLGTIDDLAALQPGFVSVTYGAGGSTRDRTLDLVTHLKRAAKVEAMAHVTCVGHSREDLATVLDRLADAKVENVLALRGDPPRDKRRSRPLQGGSATPRSSSPSFARRTTRFAWEAPATRKGTWRHPHAMTT